MKSATARDEVVGMLAILKPNISYAFNLNFLAGQEAESRNTMNEAKVAPSF